MDEALPSHQTDVAGNLVHVEWLCVQTAVGQSLSVFVLKKVSYGRTKSNYFLCHPGAGDLNLRSETLKGVGYWLLEGGCHFLLCRQFLARAELEWEEAFLFSSSSAHLTLRLEGLCM